MKLESAESEESKNLTFMQNCNPRLGPLENWRDGKGWKLALTNQTVLCIVPKARNMIKYSVSHK